MLEWPAVAALREIQNVRQIPGEHRRRWFASETIDLIVWLDEGGAPLGFQLCYDKGRNERAVTFEPAGGMSCASVDDGEAHAGPYKETPILLPGGYFDPRHVERLFGEAKEGLPEPIVRFVTDTLAAAPSPGPMSR
jgi:hypothetical protein